MEEHLKTSTTVDARGMLNPDSPITRLAEQVVVWHPDDLFLVQGHDTRSARDMRDHLMRYKKRCFSPASEAGCSKIDWKIKVTIRASSIWYCTFFACIS